MGPIHVCMGSMGDMKTTVEIQDHLLQRAKAEACRRGVTLRALVEQGLRNVLEDGSPEAYVLPDRSVGDPDGDNPLERLTWNELRREIYGDPV